MQHAFAHLPGLFAAGRSPFKTYARHPVWKDSYQSARFFPISKKEAYALYRKLKAWSARQDIETRTVTKTVTRDGKTVTVTQQRPTKYGGGIGSTCLRVFECLVFDFLNFRTGRLDPSYERIAARTGLGRSTVAEALRQLRKLGIISWARRCYKDTDENGAFRLKQDTNAYGVCPASQWLGYVEPRALGAAPVPHPSVWGAAPRVPTVAEMADEAKKAGGWAAYARVMRDYAEPGSVEASLGRIAEHFGAEENAAKS